MKSAYKAFDSLLIKTEVQQAKDALCKLIAKSNEELFKKALTLVMSPRLIELCVKKRCGRPFKTLGINFNVYRENMPSFPPKMKKTELLQDGKVICTFETY